jgi:hypothetical protein
VTAYQTIQERCAVVLADDGSSLVCPRVHPRPLDAVIAMQTLWLLLAYVTIAASRQSDRTESRGAGNSPAARSAQRSAVIDAGDQKACRRRCSTAAACGPTHAILTGHGYRKIGRVA